MNIRKYYEIKEVSDITVTLIKSNPLIVRRIEVLSDISLYELHLTIQFAMGWKESHLFELTRGDITFGARYPETEDDFPDLIEALGVPVAGVLKRP